MSAQSQNEFIKLIGHEVQQRTIEDVKDSWHVLRYGYTTPNVSHKDQLAIACLYMDEIDQPTERLVSFTEAKDKTGEGGVTEIIGSPIKQSLKVDEVTITHAASMSGRLTIDSLRYQIYAAINYF